VRDVAVIATFRKAGGPPGGGYGLIVRDQGPGPRDGRAQGGRFHAFAVGDRGEAGAWRREGDRWVDLVPWTPSEAVRPGDRPNQLAVRAAGGRLAFEVNGQPVAEVEDPAPEAGRVGVFAGGDGNEVELLLLAVQPP
jgi:hypothetical protein